MAKEYAIYPFYKMGISQRHDQGNHTPHWNPFIDYADKPWDECCGDSGQDYFYPQNEFVIEEVLGLRQEITNTVRLKSVNKLYTPFKEEPDYLYLTLTHMNEDNLKQLKVGQVIHKGEKIIKEGTDGYATGNHFHCTANFGKYYGYKTNANGKVCMVYEKSLLPTEAFYVDLNWTKVINANNYKFKEVPAPEKVGTPVARNEEIDQIEVIADVLNGRVAPWGEAKGFVNKGIYNILGIQDTGDYTWYNIEKDLWIAYSPEWENILPKKEKPIPVLKFKVGDRVIANGNIYNTEDAETAAAALANFIGTIESANAKAAHPYKLNTIVGYVDENILQEYVEPTPPVPPTPETEFKVGDTVVIIGLGNGSSKGNGDIAYGLGWTREILKVFEDGRTYCYKVGKEKEITGYYPKTSLFKK